MKTFKEYKHWLFNRINKSSEPPSIAHPEGITTILLINRTKEEWQKEYESYAQNLVGVKLSKRRLDSLNIYNMVDELNEEEVFSIVYKTPEET